MREDVITLMGQELGAIHADSNRADIRADRERRTPGWLLAAALAAAKQVQADFGAWAEAMRNR
jgi:hypothetical protein